LAAREASAPTGCDVWLDRLKRLPTILPSSMETQLFAVMDDQMAPK